MDIDNEEYDICTRPDTTKGAHVRSLDLLPKKSRKQYEHVYKRFMEWRALKKLNSFSENVVMAYFDELSKKYKSPSLWAIYSMLRSTLSLNNGINIETYLKLKALLKRKSVGYQPKKARTFTADQINQFLNEAPNEVYLAMKVVLIMGVIGACRSQELHNMKVHDVQDLGSLLLIRVPDTKTRRVRRFTITDYFYQICKTYINLRPKNTESKSFFLSYYNGKVRTQNVGINKFPVMVKQIAKFLKLANPETYTGRSFRRSSATLQVDSGGNFIALKRHGGWRAASVAEEYTVDPFMRSMREDASQSSEVKIEVNSSDDEDAQSFRSSTPVSRTEPKSTVDEDSATSENSFVADSEQSSNMPEFVSTTSYLKQEEEERTQSIRKQTPKDSDYLRSVDDFGREMAQDAPKEDNFEIFGKYVAAALRNMPRDLSLVAKVHIQQTLSHFELKSLSTSSAVQLPESNSSSF